MIRPRAPGPHWPPDGWSTKYPPRVEQIVYLWQHLGSRTPMVATQHVGQYKVQFLVHAECFQIDRYARLTKATLHAITVRRSTAATSPLLPAPNPLALTQRTIAAAMLSAGALAQWPATEYTCLHTRSQRAGKPSFRARDCAMQVAAGPHLFHGFPRSGAYG